MGSAVEGLAGSEGELVSSVGTASRYSGFLYPRISEESCASFFQNFLKFPLDSQKFFPTFELKAKVWFHTAPNWRELSLGGTFASFVCTIEPLAALFSSISSIF